MSQQTSNIHYIYGPVHSWRSGTSLGVDIVGEVSTCSFNCVYCQLGKIQKITNEIKVYVPTQKIIEDLIELERSQQFVYEDLDVITFAGSGEPTLAENLAEAIDEIRKLYASRAKQVPISILTNATMLNDAKVRERVKHADLVSLKLDAVNDEMLKAINQPAPGISITTIVAGIKALRAEIDSATTLQLQIMMMPKYLEEAQGSGLRAEGSKDVIANPAKQGVAISKAEAGDHHVASLLVMTDSNASPNDREILTDPSGPQDDRVVAPPPQDDRVVAPLPQDDEFLNQLANLIAETQVNKIQINTPTRAKPVSKTGEYWLDTRGNHYGPGETEDMKPEYIEFRELPVISKEQAFAIEDYLRNALKDRVSGLEIVNVYKR